MKKARFFHWRRKVMVFGYAKKYQGGLLLDGLNPNMNQSFDADGISENEWRAFIGEKSDYYITKWQSSPGKTTKVKDNQQLSTYLKYLFKFAGDLLEQNRLEKEDFFY